MPDLQNFSITRGPNVQMTVPTWTIDFDITDPQTGRILRSFHGANALSFPQVLGQLTQAQQDDFVSTVVQELIKRRAPELYG